MTEDDILSHFLNALDVSRFQEVLTETNTCRCMRKEHDGDMTRLTDFLDARVTGDNVNGALLYYEERKVTLQQVMAMCVEVEERAALKAGTAVAVVNAVNVQLCHYCQKPGHKYRMC